MKNGEEDGDPKKKEVHILKSFSINPETFDLCIAKKNNSVTYTYFDGSMSVEGGGISMEEINYKKYIENNITPLNFLIVLHLLSEDIEFMDDVVSLALGEGKINPLELTYVDSLHETKIRYDYSGPIKETCPECGTSDYGEVNNGNILKWYSPSYHTKTTKRYTYKLYVSNADTWLISSSKNISQKPQHISKVNEGAPEYKGKGGPLYGEHTHIIGTDPNTGKPKSDKFETQIIAEIYEKITTSTLNIEFTVVDKEKQIKVDDFVKLIKQYPKVENNFTTAPSNIFYLLRQDENTLWHERVMRYVLYKLTDIDYGVLDGELDGILRDGLNQIGDAGGDILKAAKIVHDKQMHWTYYEDFSQLKGDINQAYDNPNQVTCCSTYVSTVLYVAQIFTEEEIETPVFGNIGFNSPIWVNEKLKSAGWEKITNASDLEPGDIVIMNRDYTGNPDHVQIYAGDDTWYNAGNTFDIQAPAPKLDAAWEAAAGEWWAYRPPNSDPSSIQVIPGNVLEAAQKLHDAQRDWQYTNDYKAKYGNGGLVYSNFKKSLNNPKKVTCCSTYVSQVLHLAGYFSIDEMNKIGYNYQVELNKLLRRSGWEKIEEESALQAGDVVFLDKPGTDANPDHVQIYAGNDMWYNAGNTNDIQGVAPVKRTNWVSYGGWTKWWAYRPPVLEQEDNK